MIPDSEFMIHPQCGGVDVYPHVFKTVTNDCTHPFWKKKAAGGVPREPGTLTPYGSYRFSPSTVSHKLHWKTLYDKKKLHHGVFLTLTFKKTRRRKHSPCSDGVLSTEWVFIRNKLPNFL